MPDTLNPENIGIIILAAGSSRRFEGDKRQARMADGKTLLASTLANIPASFQHRLLVLAPGEQSLARQYQTEGWRITTAPNATLGMGHSLAAGIAEAKDWDAAVIGLGDMPWVKPQSYSLLQEALCLHPIVTLNYRHQRGNPVGFQHHLFPELAALQGDMGARALLKHHPSLCFRLEVDDPGILRDVDIPQDLRQS